MIAQPTLRAVASALPDHVDQSEVRDLACEIHPELRSSRYLALFDNAGIKRRCLVQPLEWYQRPHPPEQRWALAAHCAAELATRAAVDALAAAGVAAGEVDALVTVSSTVLRSPGPDATIAPAVGLRPDVRRLPISGPASLGGALGLATAADLVAAGHRHVLVVAAEANSLMFEPDPEGPGPEELVTMALFSDGAAAAVISQEGPGIALVGSHSTLVEDSLDVMGFEPAPSGLRWRLSQTVPEVARAHTAASVDACLDRFGWSRSDLDYLLVHPGGRKVVAAAAEALGLDTSEFWRSLEVLADHGNLSSVTVLVVLERFLADGPPPGRGLLSAMGPGFGFEHVLWES